MSSKLETLLRVFKLGLINFFRNRWLTVGATLLMTLTLTMVMVSLLISYIIKDTTDVIRDKINLTIYFRDDSVESSRIIALGERIKQLPDVVSITFIDKKQALEIFKRLPINEDVKQPVTNDFNPLPRSLEVATSNPDALETLQSGIESTDIDKIICSECLSLAKNKEVVDQLISGTRAIQQAGWLLSFFFGMIAIVNVFNIIRLAITARSDEIEIMRYVGASNAFVRGPFVIEGILYGLVGTIVTTISIPLLARILLFTSAGQGINAAFSAIGTNMFSYLVAKLPVLILVQLAIGIGLGTIVSVLSIRKFLRA